MRAQCHLLVKTGCYPTLLQKKCAINSLLWKQPIENTLCHQKGEKWELLWKQPIEDTLWHQMGEKWELLWELGQVLGRGDPDHLNEGTPAGRRLWLFDDWPSLDTRALSNDVRKLLSHKKERPKRAERIKNHSFGILLIKQILRAKTVAVFTAHPAKILRDMDANKIYLSNKI